MQGYQYNEKSQTQHERGIPNELILFSSPVQSTGRAIVVTMASAFALALALALPLPLPLPSRHF